MHHVHKAHNAASVAQGFPFAVEILTAVLTHKAHNAATMKAAARGAVCQVHWQWQIKCAWSHKHRYVRGRTLKTRSVRRRIARRAPARQAPAAVATKWYAPPVRPPICGGCAPSARRPWHPTRLTATRIRECSGGRP